MRECIGCDISILEGQPVKNLLTQSFSSNSRKHCTALSTSIRALLDLNNNVKNDAQNIKIMFQSPMEMLDMNGNGKIQKMDFKAIISVLMLSGVLLFNPVPAGALGLGGGGWYVPSGPADMRNDYPDYVRLHDRKWGHHKCAYLPEENEEIDIFYPYPNAPKSIHANRNWFTGHFQFAVATNVDEKKCTFTAVPTNTKYAPIEKKAYPDPTIWPIVFTIFGMYALAKEETIMILQNIQNILTDDPIDHSRSGVYRGFSYGDAHVKTIKQSVRTRLHFTQNGIISGNGDGSIDGRYSVHGTWEEINVKEYEVKWTEEYTDFEVEVKGKLENGNILSGRFTSSLGFSGTFTLRRDDKEVIY